MSCARCGVKTKLYNAIRKHGEENFAIELLEECGSQEELDEREFYWIQTLDAVNKGYNIKNSVGKCGGDTLTGHPNMVEISEKISVSKIGILNPNSSPIKAKNIYSGEELFFGAISDAQRYFGLPSKDRISKRVAGKTKLLMNGWAFAYLD